MVAYRNSSEKSKMPMIYDSFAVFLEVAPYYNRFLKKSVRNYQNCSELLRIVPFIGQLPNENLACQNFTRASPGLYQGLFIGFHKCFFSIADERDGRIDKYEERVAIKLT